MDADKFVSPVALAAGDAQRTVRHMVVGMLLTAVLVLHIVLPNSSRTQETELHCAGVRLRWNKACSAFFRYQAMLVPLRQSNGNGRVTERV